MAIILRPISSAATKDLSLGRTPSGVRVAPDYPTEFSAGVGKSAIGVQARLGPFFLHRAGDDVVVGEIGAAFVTADTAEIGYAIVPSCWGRGYATEAVRALIERLREAPGLARVIAHTPLDRPASARVLEKAGFTFRGEHRDKHEGTEITVIRWELPLRTRGRGRDRPAPPTVQRASGALDEPGTSAPIRVITVAPVKASQPNSS